MSPRMSALGGIGLMLAAILVWFVLGKALESSGEEGQILAIALGMLVAILPDLYYRATKAPGTFIQKFFWTSLGFRVRWVPLWVVGLMLSCAALARWFRIGTS